MKYDKCEMGGCRHKAVKTVKNGHKVCDDCYKKLKHEHKVHKHNVFFKEVVISRFDKDTAFCIDVPVKFV